MWCTCGVVSLKFANKFTSSMYTAIHMASKAIHAHCRSRTVQFTAWLVVLDADGITRSSFRHQTAGNSVCAIMVSNSIAERFLSPASGALHTRTFIFRKLIRFLPIASLREIPWPRGFHCVRKEATTFHQCKSSKTLCRRHYMFCRPFSTGGFSQHELSAEPCIPHSCSFCGSSFWLVPRLCFALPVSKRPQSSCDMFAFPWFVDGWYDHLQLEEGDERSESW